MPSIKNISVAMPKAEEWQRIRSSLIPSPPRSCSEIVPVTAPRATQELKAKANAVTPDNEPGSAEKKNSQLQPKTSPMYLPLRSTQRGKHMHRWSLIDWNFH